MKTYYGSLPIGFIVYLVIIAAIMLAGCSSTSEGMHDRQIQGVIADVVFFGIGDYEDPQVVVYFADGRKVLLRHYTADPTVFPIGKNCVIRYKCDSELITGVFELPNDPETGDSL